jgi:hypothetical protein
VATILITWELGVELGHLARLAPLARSLEDRGHRVIAAAPADSKAEDALPGLERLGIPDRIGPPSNPIRRPHTWADILYNEGWCNGDALAAALDAWLKIIAEIEPDLLLLESSPTALLAALCGGPRRIPCATLGTGFALPPDISPLPDFRSWEPSYADRLRMTEERVLAAANAQLAARGGRPLERLSELPARADLEPIASFSELDHYPERRGGHYVGAWARIEGAQVEWPHGEGPRVFAYLHPFPALPELLALWQRAPVRVVAYVSAGIDPALRRAASGRLRFLESPADMEQAARGCELAVSHAGHGTTVAMLLAGKPLLQIPLQAEQANLAQRVMELGAGLMAPPDDPAAVCHAFDAMLADPRFSEGACAFAARHAGFDPAAALESVVRHLEGLVEGRP